MAEKDYFPAGAFNDPSAPYNQSTPDEEEFTVTVSQTLSKTVSVYTNQYNPVIDKDEDTGYGFMDYDTSDTDWEEVYHDNDYHTPLQLIELFGKYLDHMLNKKTVVSFSPSFLKHLRDECQEWTEDECEYIEE